MLTKSQLFESYCYIKIVYHEIYISFSEGAVVVAVLISGYCGIYQIVPEQDSSKSVTFSTPTIYNVSILIYKMSIKHNSTQNYKYIFYNFDLNCLLLAFSYHIKIALSKK